jgi:hypothetical protein
VNILYTCDYFVPCDPYIHDYYLTVLLFNSSEVTYFRRTSTKGQHITSVSTFLLKRDDGTTQHCCWLASAKCLKTSEQLS